MAHRSIGRWFIPLLMVLLELGLSGARRADPAAFIAAPFSRRMQSIYSRNMAARTSEPMASLRERVKPRPQSEIQQAPVILVVEDTESETQLDGGWELILLNDDFNSRAHVARSLVMVCQLTDDQAYEVMMQAHKYGSAVVGQYSQETAESYCEGLLASGIGCEVSKADSAE